MEKTDPELQRDLLAERGWEPTVQAGHLGVGVKGGVVALGGQASSYREKWAAEQAAKRVAGIRAVVNEIEVKFPDDEEPKSDSDIAAAVAHALKWNIFIPSDKIKVTVESGWVTLEGEVRWQFQK